MGAIVVNNEKDGALTFPGITMVWGLAVMVMIYTVGHISGAHMNPAVSLGFAIAGRMPWKRVSNNYPILHISIVKIRQVITYVCWMHTCRCRRTCWCRCSRR